MHDTRTPLLYAIIHVALATILGYFCAIHLPSLIGIDPKWGVVGLTASASTAACIEFMLLRRTLNRRIGRTGVPLPFLLKLWLSAFLAAAAGWGCKLLLGPRHPIPVAVLVIGIFGVGYFGLTFALGIPEARTVTGRVIRLIRTLKP